LTSKTVSKQPRRQRKAYYNRPLHQRVKEMTAPLAESLQKEYGIKRIPVRKGDVVLIVRGSFAGHEGKVVRVSLKKRRIYVEGVTLTKADGTEIHHPIHPSKVVITKLDLSDEWRKKIIERRR